MICKTCNKEKINIGSADGTLIAEYCPVCDPVPSVEKTEKSLVAILLGWFIVFVISGIALHIGRSLVEWVHPTQIELIVTDQTETTSL